MATIYKVEMEIVSEFCSYHPDQLSDVLEKIIHNWKDEETGLRLIVKNISVEKKV
jgi:hypothetical protein